MDNSDAFQATSLPLILLAFGSNLQLDIYPTKMVDFAGLTSWPDAEKGHYSDRQAPTLTRTIVEFLEACPYLGVMHKDLKPENFLFEYVDEDVLKTIDFGHF
ncbi:calcium-dependent kinase family protein [Medicago truncatula]|uniref:Calcium-dependent kinase family protein n=1 Tax=Medicago truncatula TaxID=3880 RepID=A0A072VIS9_MEDTR|nr:calcium-dependent kinase family protein [Medicago truncatula]